MHARASVERRSRETRDARNEGLSHLSPSVTRVVICVSRAFCSTDQEKRETSRSLYSHSTPVNLLTDYLYKRGYNRYFLHREIQWVNNTRTGPLTPHDTSTLDKADRVFFAKAPTTQPFVPSRSLFANTFTSLFHPLVAISTSTRVRYKKTRSTKHKHKKSGQVRSSCACVCACARADAYVVCVLRCSYVLTLCEMIGQFYGAQA